MRRSTQTPNAVVMVRPHHFSPNPQTVCDNAFQHTAKTNLDPESIKQAAYKEVSCVAATLEEHGIRVHVFEDTRENTPDSVFPNNWFSTHPGGHIAIYPMFTPNRRSERRPDIIEMLKREYRVQDVIDYSGLEYDGLFLEGTGAMVLDHIGRVAYVAKTNRADPLSLERFCTHFNYEPMIFVAEDEAGRPIYHTNVLMCVGTDFVMIGLDAISDDARRREIVQRFEDQGRDIIPLSHAQIANFAGNAIELHGDNGRLLVLSTRAHAALTSEQIAIIERSSTLLPLDVPTIELAGGSVRCMLAGIHLAWRRVRN